MNYALQIRNVTKRYGSFVAVDRLSLDLPTGQIVGFLGPNGAGKTTTIRMIMSILFPDEGEINVLGRPRASEVKDRVGYLPEERGLYRKMTVDACLRYFGNLKGLSGRTLTDRIDKGLEAVGLKDWKRKPVEALSKGMQQKLQFVTTVLHEPELVILDEPFSGLDPINSEMLKDLMLDLRKRGATVIFSTHQMETAQRLCDRLLLINHGRKLIDGTLADVQARFSTPVVSLSGEGDFASLRSLPGVIGGETRLGGARLELAEGTDPQAILKRAIELGRVSKFDVHTLDLHEIFVKLVAADPRPEGRSAASISPGATAVGGTR
ncbi:MAG: ABC transporter ATP-binding protein [Phycisphaerae bacterium]